ncbi:hypothetical protein ACFX15_013483 [Malus domestica]
MLLKRGMEIENGNARQLSGQSSLSLSSRECYALKTRHGDRKRKRRRIDHALCGLGRVREWGQGAAVWEREVVDGHGAGTGRWARDWAGPP